MPRTRAVLFDFGGTLYDYRCFARAEAESRAALAATVGLDVPTERVLRAHRDAMRTVFAAYGARPYYRHADMFADAVLAAFAALGTRPTVAQLADYRRLQWDLHRRDFALREGCVDTLRALRARGLHLGIVSNIDEDQLAHLLDVAGVASWFDHVVSSERAGSCKPDPGIFAIALAAARCAPAEALFVGDTLAQDVAGAKRAGMRAALVWHRTDREPPPADPAPDHVIDRLPRLLELV